MDGDLVPDFPPDFLWGSATAAHQVEGGNTNSDWWEFEHTPGTSAKEPSGDGIDHFHRYDKDFALLASLGQNAHRFSLEWSRIEPAEGEFSPAALDHYKRVLESLHRHGLTPFATLHHFTLPAWFGRRGGWLASDALELWGRYVETVSGALGDLMPYVGTINEPQTITVVGHLIGAFPPALQDLDKAREVNVRLAAAHRTAVAAVRAGRGRPLVGTCLQMNHLEPGRPDNEQDVDAAARMKAFLVGTHLHDLRTAADPGDFIGVQYYCRDLADGTSPTMRTDPPDGAELSQIGWEVYPAGFGHVLREAGTVGLPVIVTENGVAALDDAQRVRFLASHLRELKAAMDGGVDVRGYFHWSAFDNYEWGSYEPRFGLIAIDRANGLRRIVKPSAVLYGEVARTGSLAALAGAAGG